MTEDDFVKRWRYQLAGMAIYGHAGNNQDLGPMGRACRVFEVPTEVEAILRKMHSELKKSLLPPQTLPVKPEPKPEPPKAPVLPPRRPTNGQ